MVIALNSTMVMNTNRNNYKLDSPSTNKELYNNSGSNSYHHYNNRQYSQPQQPSMNYNSWYSDNSTQHTVTQYEESQTVSKEDNPSCCNCLFLQSCVDANPCCNDARDHTLPTYNNDNSRSASNVIASYGVYGTTASNDDDDDDGFVSRSGGGYRYHHSVVVNVTGNATSTNILRDTPSDDDRTCCVSSWSANRQSCCSRQQDDNGTTVPTTSEASCCSNWCRPTILLLLLALLVVIFVLISGILLYFKCTYFRMLSAWFVNLLECVVVMMFVEVCDYTVTVLSQNKCHCNFLVSWM